MATYVPTKRHFREVLLYQYISAKSAAEGYRALVETYPEHAPSEKTCRKWFARYKSGDFDVDDKERPGPVKKFDDESLQALIDQDPCQTQSQLAETLGVTQVSISNRLKKLNFVQKEGRWVPSESSSH